MTSSAPTPRRERNSREPLLVLEPLLRVPATRTASMRRTTSTAVPIGEGHSNVTFELSTGVVAAPPAARAAAAERARRAARGEAAARARADAGTGAPVLAVCDDDGVIGAPFYVMEEVQGDVITDSMPEPLDTPERARRGSPMS